MANVRYPGTAGTTPGTITASDVTYDNTTSGLTADDVQEAIDEIEGQIGSLSYDASDISYDNTTSGLTADDVQEAIDEIDSNLDTLDGKVYKTDDSTETTIASDDLLPIYDTSATASKKITVENVVKATVSNPNLIDNPWFTVNQRGQSSYTAGNAGDYCVDRWRIRNGTLTVNSDGTVRFLGSNTSGTDVVQSFVQNIERDFYDNYIMDRIITFSLMFSDGTIKSVTIVAPSSGVTSYAIVGNYCLLINVLTSIVWIAIDQLDRSQQMDITLKAVKLEIGSVSTLAMDTAPNYATELLKCQRYFVRYKQTNANAMEYGFMVASTTTSAHGIVNLPTSMRTTPSLVVADATKLSLYGQYKYSLTALSIAICDDTNKVVKLLATTSGMTAGTAYMLQADTGYGFDLTADL